MAISKSTPYVRYKKDFTSSLHLGTIHIESEYLDRTQKTTIESIHGMTWHNKVVNENKELNLLSDTQLELTELEKQYWNTGEKRVSVDEIHTLEEVEPNEDGTYTYTVNSMEGEYIEIYDGINNITSTSDGLDGQFEIVYDTTEEDINGNIALDSIVPQYEITDSGVGTVTGAKSIGLTLVNHITEPSKEEVVAIGQQEGQYFTIENTVQGNIKSAILSGQTLVNLATHKKQVTVTGGSSSWQHVTGLSYNLTPNKKYLIKLDIVESTLNSGDAGANILLRQVTTGGSTLYSAPLSTFKNGCTVVTVGEKYTNIDTISIYANSSATDGTLTIDNFMLIEYQEGMENWDIPYFEGMQSVKMPVLTTTGKNLANIYDLPKKYPDYFEMRNGKVYGLKKYYWESTGIYLATNFKPNTQYTISWGAEEVVEANETWAHQIQWKYTDGTSSGNYMSNASKRTTDVGKTLKYVIISNPWYVGGYLNNIQIEEGTQQTEYESFKSNILTVNEEVELRGIGNVKDELNCSTGELTQRISEEASINEVINNQLWYNGANKAYPYYIYTQIDDKKKGGVLICDKLPFVDTPLAKDITGECLSNYAYEWGNSLIYFPGNDITDKESALQRLSSYNALVNYELATESVKTVDLTVQNQDGNIIPHIQTQQGITHVSTSSDGLTPVVEMSCSYDTIIKPNTTYTIKLDRPIVSDTMYLQVDLGGTMMMLDADVSAFTIKTPSTLSHSQLRLSGTGNTVKEIIVLEGNRVNDKIEYFEGMKNVENPILIVSNCPYVFGKGGRL